MNCWVHSKEEKSQDRSPGLLGLWSSRSACEAVVASIHFVMSVARGGQFHATEGNVAGTDMTGLGVGRGQGESTGFRSLQLQRGRVPRRLVDPWESKPGPVFPLQMLTEVQPVLDSGAKWGWGGSTFMVAQSGNIGLSSGPQSIAVGCLQGLERTGGIGGRGRVTVKGVAPDPHAHTHHATHKRV